MPTAPTLAEVKAYLGDDQSWTDDVITSALNAEKQAQVNAVKFPADPEPPAEPLPYPADLAEALCRRVAHNLALRVLPLGLQASASEVGVQNTRVGGLDAEVRRLEGPWRKRAVA